MLENWVEIWVPKPLTAAIAIKAIKATSNAYSTMLAPFCSLALAVTSVLFLQQFIMIPLKLKKISKNSS